MVKANCKASLGSTGIGSLHLLMEEQVENTIADRILVAIFVDHLPKLNKVIYFYILANWLL